MGEGQRVPLAKLLAERGVASRRQAEALIHEGEVEVDGQVVRQPGTPVVPESASVRVKGKRLPAPPPKHYLLMYKPRGHLTTRFDPEGRRTVFDLIDTDRFDVEAVGRLDFQTEGALLLTNDGELAHRLTHPRRRVPKRYLAKVYRVPDERKMKALQSGVYLEDGKTAPAKARIVDQTGAPNAWLEITVTEGRNRLIRRMLEKLGHPVSKLRRESFATISIRGMEPGQVRPLTGDEVRRLRDIAAGAKPAKAGHGPRPKGFAKPKPKSRRRRRTKP